VRRLRALLRDRATRETEGAFVLEGPRVVEGALDRGVHLEALYLGTGAGQAFASLIERVRTAGTPVAELREGVLEKVGSTRTPQPVLAVASRITRSLDALTGSGIALVAVGVGDPGNLGTMIRSAEAAGSDAVVVCGNSVDVLNPKTVRSSAGAIFGVPVIETVEPDAALDALATQGRRCLGSRAEGGTEYDRTDLTGPVAIVVGNEARGLDADLTARLDGEVTVPMQPGAESLNVATAAAVLLFEAARQRRLARTR
jgi:TrmH family RNA methyltransferase